MNYVYINKLTTSSEIIIRYGRDNLEEWVRNIYLYIQTHLWMLDSFSKISIQVS